MKLNKDKWVKVTLDEACTFVRGVVFSTKDEVDSGGYAILRSHNVDFENSKVSLHNLKYVSDTVKVKDSQKLMKDDILISVANSKEQTGKVGFCNENTDSYAGGFMAILKPKETIHPFYLFNYLLSDESKDFIAGRTQGTTNIFNITFERIKDLEIPLPPLEEQKQIAALFHSIETAMEQVDGQERNLKALWKRLIDEFVTDVPVFGNLLNEKKIADFKFSDVTEKITRRIDPFEKGIKRRIGGENFISSDLKLRTWGNVEKDYVGPAFHMHVLPGDILYVSRNSHLRKVAYADFEGVCSNTTYVVQSNEKYVIQNLMKHIMLSERFTQYSIGVSKGSTNPYINWKDLDNFSFQVPDLETQKEIANVLDGILQIVEQLKHQKTTLKNLKQKLLNEILG